MSLLYSDIFCFYSHCLQKLWFLNVYSIISSRPKGRPAIHSEMGKQGNKRPAETDDDVQVVGAATSSKSARTGDAASAGSTEPSRTHVGSLNAQHMLTLNDALKKIEDLRFLAFTTCRLQLRLCVGTLEVTSQVGCTLAMLKKHRNIWLLKMLKKHRKFVHMIGISSGIASVLSLSMSNAEEA